MFDPRNMATGGLYPGLVTTFSVAVMGHLEFEVIIEPVVPQVYGGGGYVPGAKVDKYRVTIRVTYKGRVWNFTKEVSAFVARVWAKLLNINIKQPDVSAQIYTVSAQQETVQIKVTPK